MFTYKYMRYLRHYEEQYPTLDEAIQRAISDIEWDRASPTEIVDQTGAVVMSQDALEERALDVIAPLARS